jgi:hypothetical protein
LTNEIFRDKFVQCIFGKANTGKTMMLKGKRHEEDEEKPGFSGMLGHGMGTRVRCFN